MATKRKLERRIASTEDMQSIVSTMKSLAAVNVRVFGRARDAIESYSETVERGLQVLFAAEPSARISEAKRGPDERIGLFVFGAVQGMSAQFTDHIAHHAAEVAGHLVGEIEVVAVGPRVGSRLIDLDMDISAQVEMRGSLDELPRVVDDCIVQVDRLRAAGTSRILLVFNRAEQPSYQPHDEVLLPLDAGWLERVQQRTWPSRQIPATVTSTSRLAPALVRQYIFASFYRAAAESLTGENAVRLSSMQSAESNIDERLGELNSLYNRQRQQEITSELLDIVGGYTALEE
ncbi:MAG: FoF1 ATP synthase subunit gamma [Spirochaetota bacterium]